MYFKYALVFQNSIPGIPHASDTLMIGKAEDGGGGFFTPESVTWEITVLLRPLGACYTIAATMANKSTSMVSQGTGNAVSIY